MDPFKILVLVISIAMWVGGILIYAGWIWTGIIIVAIPVALFACLTQMRI